MQPNWQRKRQRGVAAAWHRAARIVFAGVMLLATLSLNTTLQAQSSAVQYVRLEATSEVNGNPWTSMAEFNVFDTSNATISRTGWTVSADSEETAGEPGQATNAIDGVAGTIWHTNWSSTNPPPPHTFTVNMGSAHVIGGFRYLPRSDSPDGHIAGWRFYTSTNGTTWTQVGQGTFTYSTAEKSVTLGSPPANQSPTLAVVNNQTGTVGTAATLTLVGSDPDSDPLTYSATGLPAGLSVAASTGVISGTPTTAATYNVTATVSDGRGGTASRSFTWTVSAAANQPPTLAVVNNQTTTVNTAASLTLVGSDPNGDTLTYSATGLPTGLSIATSTGVISGTPTATGTSNVTATVNDGHGGTASRSFTWTVTAAANQAPTLAVVNSQTGTVGTAATLTLVGSDPDSDPLTYSATGLPAGLSVAASTGVISGTPTTAATYSVTATVADGRGGTASRSFTWTISASGGGGGAVQYVRLEATSEVNGNPWTSMAEFNLFDTSNATISRTGWTVTVDSQETVGENGVGTNAIDGVAGTIWHTNWSSTNPPPPHTFTVNMGSAHVIGGFRYLPRSDSPDGHIAGWRFYTSTNGTTWTQVGQGTFTYSTAEKSVTLSAPPANQSPTLAVVNNQTGTVGTATSLTLVGSDPDSDPLTYSATGLPAGLSLAASTGVISGTPTTAATYNVTATVSDGRGGTASRSFTWTISAAANQPPTLAVVNNQTTTVNTAASLTLVGSDPNGDTLTYSATGLPTGLSVAASTGVISGTPTTTGTSNVTATVNDGRGGTASRSFTWTVTAAANQAPTLAVVSSQTGTVGTAATLTLVGSDPDSDPLTYSATSLPTGLTVAASTGVISGTPTTAGTYNVTATVADGRGGTASRSFTWTISAASGGGAVQYVRLEATSEVNGNPWTSMAEFNLFDTSNATISRTGWTVSADSEETAGEPGQATNAIDGVAGTIWHTNWSTTNPPPPHTFTVNMGSAHVIGGFRYLPRSDGPDGHIAGWRFYTSTNGTTWTQVGQGTFTYSAAEKSVTLSAPPANQSPTLAVVNNQTGTVGTAATLTLVGSDPDSDPLTYSATGLPAGLTLAASTGVISGTPTTAATYNVTATVSDGRGGTASRSFTWTIGAAANQPPTLAVVNSQTGTVGTAATLTLVGSDPDSDPLTYSATGLPAGLTLAASTGVISGSPTTAATYNVTATVADGRGGTASRSFTWTISAAANQPPTLAVVANQTTAVNTAATTVTLAGSDPDSDPLTYSATGLPTGLTLATGTGIVSGTPTAAGTYNVTATVSDGRGGTASQSFVWTVTGTPAELPPVPTSPAPVVNYEYDAKGNPTRTVQAPGSFAFAASAAYDGLDRKESTTNARGGRTQLFYDGGREALNRVNDPRSLNTTYDTNGLGDTTQVVSPDTGTANQTYDAAGNLLTRTDSNGALATYTYDSLNRLTQGVYTRSGYPTQTYTWVYDQSGAGFSNGIGRLTSTTHPNGSTQHAYDPQGRLLVDTQRVNATTGANTSQLTQTVTYSYNTAGKLTGIVYPSGRALTIAYTDGQPSGLSLAPTLGGTDSTLISQIQYAPFGAAQSWLWQLASGTQLHQRVFDSSGRLVRYRLGSVVRDLVYDAADRITSYTHYDAITATAQTGLNQGFGYDATAQLTSITAGSSSWTIGYDANGNRSNVSLNGTGSAYITAANSNKLDSVTNPARALGYDNAGNITSDTGNAYTSTYDASGRLATLVKAGVTTTYSYNAQGQRVRKFSSSGAASTVVFVYDQGGQLLGEYSSTGTPIREYVWLGSTPIAIFTPDPANAANPPLVYYIHADHLDAPRVVLDRSNNQRWTWFAEPFGTTAPNSNPQNIGAFNQPLRFPGQYADSESGLNYNFFRDYDPTIGRYVQSDPIGLQGGINTFAYVQGNPLSYTDPNGEFIFVPMLWGAGVGAVTDIALQLALNGGNFECIKWGQVGVSAGLGAIGGGVGSYLAKLRQVRQAYQAWATRRAIGQGLKQETPAGARDWIYGRNLQRYGDELGPQWNPAKMSDATKTLTDTNPWLDNLLRLPSRGLPSVGGAAAGAGAAAVGDCTCQ